MPVALFDLDGTLTDPAVGITRSVAYALGGLGLPVPGSLTAYIGPPLRESFRVHAGLDEAGAEHAVALYREYFADTGIFENAVIAGIPEMLGVLAGEGWTLAIATSKPTVYAERILDRFALSRLFPAVAGAELDGTRSRKGEVIAAALERLGVGAGPGVVMIGDREQDVAGAREQGVAAVGVTWGYGSAAELAGADLLAHHVAELPGALRRTVLPSS